MYIALNIVQSYLENIFIFYRNLNDNKENEEWQTKIAAETSPSRKLQDGTTIKYYCNLNFKTWIKEESQDSFITYSYLHLNYSH